MRSLIWFLLSIALVTVPAVAQGSISAGASLSAGAGLGAAVSRVVADGDSITAGIGNTSPYTANMTLTLAQPIAISNIAQNGQNMANMDSNYAANAASLFCSTCVSNDIVPWGGTNDLANQNLGVSATYNHVISYCSKAHTTGFKCIVPTMLSRTPTNFGGFPIFFSVPSTGPFTVTDYSISVQGVSYRGGAALTEVGSNPTVGQFTFSSTGTHGTYTFNSGDAGQPLQVLETANVDAMKNDYNTLILANTANADAVVDFTGTNLGCDGCYSNSTYFQSNGIHPNQSATNTIVAPMIATKINAVH